MTEHQEVHTSPSRRNLLLRGGLWAALAGLATGVLSKATARPAAASTGDALVLGDWAIPASRNLAEDPTTLLYDGPQNPGAVLVVEDTGYSPMDTIYPCLIAGWAGGTVPGIKNGFYGWTNVSGGNGVVGRTVAFSGGAGVRGESFARDGDGVFGTNAAVGGAGVRGLSTIDGTPAVVGTNHAGQGSTGVLGQSVLGFGVFAEGRLGATGTGLAIVPHPDGTHRALYCMESPECWFEDFGSATLVGGAARVELDPDFVAVVDSSRYHVFLTPEGDSRGLYVTGKTPSSFEVREQAGGASNVSFSYGVVARRRDVVAPRLEKVTLPSTGAPARPAPADPTRQVRP